MKIKICTRLRKLLSCNATQKVEISNHEDELDLREEYVNAFRTESYNKFWSRVLAFTKGNRNSATFKSVESKTAARLPSYRLFAEHFLEPDQDTIIRVLALAHKKLENYYSHFSDYFSITSNASLLCGLLLKDIDSIRVKYGSLKATIKSLEMVQTSSINHLPLILTRLNECSNFSTFVSTTSVFQAIQASCSNLLKNLEISRDKVQAKLCLVNKIKHGSGVFLVALTATLFAIVTFHALAIVVAAPSLIATSIKLTSTKKLTKLSAQLDAAAKGAYILNRDLDTISRLVARLNDELEHMRGTIKFWIELGENRLQASGEVARRLIVNDSSFSDQLDELEEHLYLCFMTINRARNLVVQEILGAVRSKPTQAPNML